MGSVERAIEKEEKAIRELLNRMDKRFEKMDEQSKWMNERAEQRHIEVIATSDQRHQDVVELLKMGFGDLNRDIQDMKA